jgi:hypothetical protein
LFVAVAYSGTGNRAMSSPDGVNWTVRSSAANNGWRSVCWSPKLAMFVAVSEDGTGNRVMIWSFSKLTLTITESLAATKFIARAHRIDNGALIGNASGPGSTLVLPTDTAVPVNVTVMADQGGKWTASKAYALNDKVFPSNPAAKPYYYKRLVAGTSGATEPTWPTTPGGKCNDGAVADAWELVERLTQPITQGPLIPS